VAVIRPELVLNRPSPGCKVSVILLDWGVRESFHTLEYLNRQTAARSDYELIWLEFYARKPEGLRRLVESGVDGRPALDKWVVAGYPDEYLFNKHRLYNVGILASEGEICVICDSDAIFTPGFIERVIRAFQETPRAVVHLDEVRNWDPNYYPFRYPSLEEVRGEMCFNWNGTVTKGIDNSLDMLHEANYGACMAARRDVLIEVGGADEHLDYLGYVCGPYEITFRLVNAGFEERWLRDEFLYHTWHPNVNGINTDYHGPHDGRMMSTRALEARIVGRVRPCVESPWVARARGGERLGLDELLRLLAEREEPKWRAGEQPTEWDGVFWLERDYHGFNLFLHKDRWYGLPLHAGVYDPAKAHRYRVIVEAETQIFVRQQVDYYNALPKDFWGRLRTQPLHLLPSRIVRRLGKEVARLF
jgi:glycosyltransferase involved in cell wall biosynthesis